MTPLSSYNLYCEASHAMSLGDLKTAEELFSLSLSLGPHYKTCLKLSQIFKQTDRHAEFRKMLVEAYRLNPNSDMVCVNYAETLITDGEIQQALEILNAVLARNTVYGPAIRLKAQIETMKM